MDSYSPSDMDDDSLNNYLSSIEGDYLLDRLTPEDCTNKYRLLVNYLVEQVELSEVPLTGRKMIRVFSLIDDLSTQVISEDILREGISSIIGCWVYLEDDYLEAKGDKSEDLRDLSVSRSIIMSMMDKITDTDNYMQVFGALVYESVSNGYDRELFNDLFKLIQYKIGFLMTNKDGVSKTLCILNSLYNTYQDNALKWYGMDKKDEDPFVFQDFYLNNFIKHLFMNVAGSYGARFEDIHNFFDTIEYVQFDIKEDEDVLITRSHLN